jgi:hypothetical protein
MIWFICKQCGKKHGRGESMVGTLVFCECGAGNRVPWNSTTTEPEDVPAVAAPAQPPPPPPPAAERRPPPSWTPRRRPEVRRVNTGFCFNHEDTPSAHACADCDIGFCSRCVVTLNGETLCGPCKNLRMRFLSRPEQVPGMSIWSLVLGLVGGPAALFLTVFSMDSQATFGSLLLCLLGMVLPTAALIVGLLALREIDTKAQCGGRSLAVTGATTGLFGTLWSLTIALIVISKQLQG